MIISDAEIKERVDSGNLVITPFERGHVEPASVDLRLGSNFTKIEPTGRAIDTRDASSINVRTFDVDRLELYPGETILGTTLEKVELPEDLVGTVVGRSSLGRLDVVIHKTAGFVDPGFSGTITLEIENEGQHPVILYPGDRVCQIWFADVFGVDVPYGEERGSQYQHQSGATASGFNFE